MSFYFDYNVPELTERINEQFERLKKENAELREQLCTFNRDEEIEQLKKTNARLRKYSLMNMSEKEYLANNGFISRHWQEHNNGNLKGIANTYLYELTGTGIGTAIKIKCPICGEEEDITDTDNW